MGQFNPFIGKGGTSGGSESGGGGSIDIDDLVKKIELDEKGNLVVTYVNNQQVKLDCSLVTDSSNNQKYRIGIENKKVYVEEVES